MLGRAVTPLVLVAVLAQPGRAQVSLAYKYPEGEATKNRTVVKTHQVLTLAGNDIATDSDQTIVTSLAVGKRDGDGNLPVVQKVESLRAQLSLPGGLSVSFDSANPDAKIDNPQLAFLGDVFRASSGLSFTVVLDAKDGAKAVEKIESRLVKFDDLDPKAKELVKGEFDAERLLKQFRQAHANLPEILVRVGEPWDLTESSALGGGQTLTFKNRYEYRGTVEHDCCTLDKIDVKAREVTYEMAADSPSPLKLDKSDLKIESSGGTILFDRKRGLIVERKDVTRIKGEMTFKAGEVELPATLDLTLDVATNLEP